MRVRFAAARHSRRLLTLSAAASLSLTGAGCGLDDDDGVPPEEPSLEDFLPELPDPTGGDQSVFAGEITTDNPEEIVAGPAQTAMPGDYYMRNERGRFVIGAPTRVVGVVPQGGNLIGAAPLDDEGEVIVGDHFGELSFVYLVGRTCEPESVEVVRDGSGGGAAVVQARGTTAPNDYINLRGVGLLSVPRDLDPDIEDDVECAITYILEPDSPSIQVRWTLFNPREGDIQSPFASLADTGGNIEAFAPMQGFERLGIAALTTAGDPAPADYVVYQGPGVSYGALPAHADDTVQNTHFFVAGVSILLFGGESLLDILSSDRFHLDLPGKSGVTHGVDFVVGRDATDVESAFLRQRGRERATLEGEVTWAEAEDPARGARVGIFEDHTGSGDISDDDHVRTYADVDESGRFEVELEHGDYLVRADVEDTARSEVFSVSVPGDDELDIELPDPMVFDYEVRSDDDLIPAKITVIGENPAEPQGHLFDTHDREAGVVRMIQAVQGTSVIGTDPDERLRLPAGGTYRVIATRGTEYSYDSVQVPPEEETDTLEFELHRVARPSGYLSSEFHVHAIGSPDSPVEERDRVATAAADGVSLFAQTDHDYVADLQPVVEDMGLVEDVRAVPGLEVTPFVYGHFNAFPIEPDESSPNRGAIDWGDGDGDHAMLPSQIFDAARDRGADVVQVNHPRASAGSIANFMHYFDRAELSFDYDDRVVYGDPRQAPVPNDWLRLPEEASLWDDGFDAVEVWNSFDIADTNEDGVRETARLDLVLADWFNFLSFGMDVTPIASSDTHTIVEAPMGMPRTYVRVDDDSGRALADELIVDDVAATLTGRDDTPRDVVLTNGPHIEVSVQGDDESALGRVVDGDGGEVTLDITVYAAPWAHLDTLEIYANATPPIGNDAGPLEPHVCFTDRDEPSAPCAAALDEDEDLVVQEVEVDEAGGEIRLQIEQEVTIDAGDIETRDGASGDDAWIVVRARGNRGIFPVYLNGILDSSNMELFVEGSEEDRAEALDELGVPATAVTAPVFVNFEGESYRAPFAPE